MTDPIDYYRIYYSKYYNHEAIKQHMIEKQIYSPSDFRYYSSQLLEDIGNAKSIQMSHDMLHEFEKKYIEDSIAFLFNQKKQDDESNPESLISRLFSLPKQLSSIPYENPRSVQRQNNSLTPVTKEETLESFNKIDNDLKNDDLIKLLNLLHTNHLESLIKTYIEKPNRNPV